MSAPPAQRADWTGTAEPRAQRVEATPRSYSTRAGTHFPPGATADAEGVNFSIYSMHAGAAQLLLYESPTSPTPFQVISLQRELHRTFFFWHVYVEGLAVGTYYTWRVVDADPELGAAPELLDPWARAVSDAVWDRRAAMEGERHGQALRAIVTQHDHIPIAPLAPREPSEIVIYEMHVGGFTRHPSSATRHPGTYAALIEKIPYLKDLGITHVEFLPVMAFDEQDVPPAALDRGLKNYWGYSTCGFYAPHPGYCIDETQAPHEFRECVRALHAAGIGVLLDVVFNHTAEGGEAGPTIHFKALADKVFYHHEASDPKRYRDFSGCGNTVNCNHPLVANYILHCLEYWTEQFGVDGFRFDLASIFTRGENGEPLADPPLTWGIELSHALAKQPLIAEAWDASGLYQVGAFPGMRWAEWNGRYRDVLRRFVRGEAGLVNEVATRIAGSGDMYRQRSPLHSVNFVTCHDGFTLWDLVSYSDKHNEDNGESNRDGSNDNFSWNCGAEGETRDAGILQLRRRQAKNLLAILFLSQGVPMILAGDEVLRSQQGNNNAYSQDNEISWFDWGLTESNREMLQFTRELIAFRKRHPSLHRRSFLSGSTAADSLMPDIEWHGERLKDPPWHDPDARLLAFTLAGVTPEEPPLHVVLNMWWESRTVHVPVMAQYEWKLVIDTARESPADIALDSQARIAVVDRYVMQPRSVVVLEGERRTFS